jgi:putative lipoprotein
MISKMKKINLIVFGIGAIFVLSGCTGQHDSTSMTDLPEAVNESKFKDALGSYLAAQNESIDNTKYQIETIDLNDNGYDDALVLLTGPMWCGTGGCTLLIFEGLKDSARFVSDSSLVRGPITVSTSRTKGWRDLVIKVSGGGAVPGKVALKFDGSKYPLNPSNQPRLDPKANIEGDQIFRR